MATHAAKTGGDASLFVGSVRGIFEARVRVRVAAHAPEPRGAAPKVKVRVKVRYE